MPHAAAILLVDDEESILKTLGRALRDEGHEVARPPRARRRRSGCSPSAPSTCSWSTTACRSAPGLELIRDLAAAVPEGERPQIVMMTAHATVENAIEAMKLGAFDYLQKPFEVDELLVAVRRALEHQRLRTPAPLPADRARGGVRPLRHRGPQPRRSRSSCAGSSWWRGRRAPCSSPARPAPARSWWRAPSTPAAPSATCPSSR